MAPQQHQRCVCVYAIHNDGKQRFRFLRIWLYRQYHDHDHDCLPFGPNDEHDEQDCLRVCTVDIDENL